MTQQPQANRWQYDGPEVDAWSAMSSIISAVLLWGAIGYGFSQWLGSRAYMGAGVVIGGVLGVLVVYLRYGRDQSGPPVTAGPVLLSGQNDAVPGARTPGDGTDTTPALAQPLVSLPAHTAATTAEEDTP